MPRHYQSFAVAAIVIIVAAFSYMAIRHNNNIGNESVGTSAVLQ